MERRRLLLAVAVGALLVGGTYVARHYRAEVAAAEKRVSAGSEVISTRHGRMEYSVRGGGTPVMMIHGTGGGFDRFGTAATARDIAAYVPRSRLLIFPDGGHVWIGHDDRLWAEVASFIGASH